jgi:hypothetical protein
MVRWESLSDKLCPLMKTKPSIPTPQSSPKNSTNKTEAKPAGASGSAVAAEDLANELLSVSIVEVAKIAAQLSILGIAPFEAVNRAYTLLELSAIAKPGLKNGYGFKFPLVDSQNFPDRYGSSNLRWEELKFAFSDIETADKSYRVPFVEGLSKLMGRNTETADRPEILRRFMVQEAQNIWGDNALNENEIDILIKGFKADGISQSFFTSLWFYFPRWRESDVRAIKADNASKKTRKARPPKASEDEVLAVKEARKLAQVRKES